MKLIKAFRKYLEHDRQVQELRAMTDRELSDIGIHRLDIPRLVRGE